MLNIEYSVVVITPTIGQEVLIAAIDSVKNQTYRNLKHLVVVDGDEYWDQTLLLNYQPDIERFQLTRTPENTGKTGGDFWGHRIFASYPHLVNADYVCFLDEDNWYEPNHVSSLVNLIQKKNLDWAYSLRNVFCKEGMYVEKDCCESLGKWPIYWSLDKEHEHLVDTSAYCFKRNFLIQVCQHWHSGWGADRRFFNILTKYLDHTNFDTTGLHTMNYRLDEKVEQKYGNIDFFKLGNDVVLKHYGGTYPWLET